MTEFSNRQISPPKDWDAFEELCADLWTKILNDPDVTRHGRSGQLQHGVDVYGRVHSTGPYVGVQCKGKNGNYGAKVTEAEFRAEAIKAESFAPPLSKFTLVSTAPHDGAMQAVARQLSTEYEARGLFKVTYFGWDEIQRLLSAHLDLIDKHYPEQGPTNAILVSGMEQLLSEAQFSDNWRNETSESLGLILGQLGVTKVTQDASDLRDEIYGKELDTIRDLIGTKPLTALALLETFKTENWENLSDRARFRVLTNIGACKLQLDETAEAADLFLQAHSFNCFDEKAETNLALASVLRGDMPEAHRLAKIALEHHPESSRAVSLVVATMTDQSIDPVSIVPADMLELSDIAYAVSSKYWTQGKFDVAVEWSRKSLELDPDSFDCALSHASNLLQYQTENVPLRLGNSYSEPDQLQIEEACSILEALWQRHKATEVVAGKSAIINNLLIALRLLGRQDQALQILNQALALGFGGFELARQKAYLFIEKDKLDDAASELEPWLSEYGGEIGLLFTEILINTDRLQKAFDYLKSLKVRIDQEPIYESIILHLKLSLEGDDQTLRDHIDALNSGIPSGYWLATIIKHTDIRFGRQEAHQIIEQHFSAALDQSDDGGILSLAESAYLTGHFYAAATAFERIHTTDTDSEITRKLLICYYETNARKKGIELLERLPDKTLATPYFLRTSAFFQLRIGNTEEAEALLGEYVRQQPDDLRMTLNWLILLTRNESQAQVVSFLANAPGYPDAKPIDRLDFAQILAANGFFDRALQIAYDARRRGYEDPAVHTRYIGFLLGKDSDEQAKEPNQITPGCGVVYTDSGGNTKRVFLESGNYPIGIDTAISLDNPYAKALLGKSRGDTVEVPISIYRKDIITINEVTTRYTHFFRETMNGFEERFPGQQGLMRFDLPRDEAGELDPTPLIESLHAQRAQTERYLESYRTHPLPIGVLADWMKRHPFEVWEGLATTADIDIVTCEGSHEERQNGLDMVSNNIVGYVIDPLVLFHHHRAGSLESLSRLCPSLAITQSALNLIESRIEQIQGISTEKGRSTLVASGDDGMAFVDAPREQVDEEIAVLKNLIAWTKTHCTLLSAVGSGDVSKEANEFIEAMHDAFTDCIMAAQQTQRLLLSDDARLRFLAKAYWGVDGVWSQLIFFQGKQKQTISQGEYFSTLKGYFYCGIDFTTFTGKDLEDASNSGASWRNLLQLMLERLGRPTSDIRSSFNVAKEFLARVWISEREVLEKAAITNMVLTGLTRNYCHEHSKGIIRMLASLRAEISPFETNLFVSVIRWWLAGHFISLTDVFPRSQSN